MFDVAVVGSVNLDLVVTTHRLPRPGETVVGTQYAEHAGGKGLNQAVAAARSGARVALIAAVGDDEAGGHLRALAEGEGIDVSRVAVVPGRPTGRALITVDERAENSIVVVAGANAAVRTDAAADARVVLAQLEVPVEQVIAAFRAARDRRALTILNPAPAIPLPDALLALCDVVVPNEHELALLNGVDSLRARGVATVVTTRGGAGVDVVDDGGAWTQPAFPVQPVDTTGAGDAFCGVLAARLATGDDLRTAVRKAAAAGALAATAAGAVPSLPRARAIDDLLAGTGAPRGGGEA